MLLVLAIDHRLLLWAGVRVEIELMSELFGDANEDLSRILQSIVTVLCKCGYITSCMNRRV